jgi:hypothetical protein
MAVEALVVGHGVWELQWTKLDEGGGGVGGGI